MYGSMTTVTLLMLWLYVHVYFPGMRQADLFFGGLFDRLLRRGAGAGRTALGK